MNRLFKYILLLASVVCNFSCEKEIDLNEYTVTKIYYRTSDDKPITQSDGWNSEFDSQILADSYSADNGGCLLVYGKVTTFDVWFQYCSTLTEINIPSGIKYISEDAFGFCSSLTSITIPDSVTTIGDYAFYYCTSLTSVTIPESVTAIRACAFFNCTSLTGVTIPDSVTTIGDYAFYYCYRLISVYCEAIAPTSLGTSVFDSNASDRKIYVPLQSVEVYKSADGWKDYADAIIGYDLETGEEVITNNQIWYTNGSTTTPTEPYDSSAFGANIVSNRYDSSLECWVITFDADVKRIGVDAFFECSSLTSITIPDSVTTIGDYAFSSCSSLSSITIPDSVTTIGDYAFSSCASLTSITIPDSVTTIGDYAFSYCTRLTSASIPDRVTMIRAWTFSYCSSLTSVTIPDSVTTIGDCAFYKCSSLISVTIPDSVTTIGSWAFYDCISLTNVTIPDSVTTIGSWAFFNCASLTRVYCTAAVPPLLGNIYVFSGNSGGRIIYVPAASVESYKSAEYWSNYTNSIVGYDF